MIPSTITVTGDIPKGREFVGFAKNQLAILQNQMSFQGLETGFRTVTPFPGIVVRVWSSFNLSQIHIDVKKQAGEEERFRVKKEEKTCLCLPHFSLGIIKKVDPETILTSTLDEANVRILYDVEICAEDRYLLYEGALDANLGMYEVGQFVLVSIGDEMDEWELPLDCQRDCLLDFPRFETLIVVPIHVVGFMGRWLKNTVEYRDAI